MQSDDADGTEFQIGSLIERDLDGMGFNARIIRIHPGVNTTVDIEYDEDGNIEEDVPLEEICLRSSTSPTAANNDAKTSDVKKSLAEAYQESLLLPACDYDPNKVPTVVIHRKGEKSSDAGYIINGPETNIAAGNGLRGIRWLRKK